MQGAINYFAIRAITKEGKQNMAFIKTIKPADATGATHDMYARQQASYGYVPNYAKVFGHRPEVMARWGRLLAEIRRPMSDRLFELATFAAAHELGNTACSLAHGQQLAKFIDEEGVHAVATGEIDGHLTEAEESVVAFARKVANDATAATQADVDALKSHGYSDAEVFDIAITVAGRSFLATTLDALGVQTDVTAMDMSEAFRNTLTVGRPISTEEVETLDS
jgi:alkylhydroperoxidase family enzyme